MSSPRKRNQSIIESGDVKEEEGNLSKKIKSSSERSDKKKKKKEKKTTKKHKHSIIQSLPDSQDLFSEAEEKGLMTQKDIIVTEIVPSSQPESPDVLESDINSQLSSLAQQISQNVRSNFPSESEPEQVVSDGVGADSGITSPEIPVDVLQSPKKKSLSLKKTTQTGAKKPDAQVSFLSACNLLHSYQ